MDYIFESVCRTRALLFTPFNTRDVLYDTTEQLLQSCGFVYPAVPVLEALVSETERVMIFAEGRSGDDVLRNLEASLSGMNVDVSDRKMCYEKALMVVVDRVSGIPINVDHRHCWWVASQYNIGAGPDFFSSKPLDFMVNAHRFLKACMECTSHKTRCIKTASGECRRCVKGGLECEAGPMEAIGRRRGIHRKVKSELGILSAIHQYIIVTHGRRLHEQIMAAGQVERLLVHVTANVRPAWNMELEMQFQAYADSFQIVTIEDGKLRVDEEKEMSEWWGYECLDEKMPRDDRRAIISPHLGMCHYEDAIMFIDHALRKPGELFFRDECLMNRSFKPVSVRIMVVAAIMSPTCVHIALGWKKP